LPDFKACLPSSRTPRSWYCTGPLHRYPSSRSRRQQPVSCPLAFRWQKRKWLRLPLAYQTLTRVRVRLRFRDKAEVSDSASELTHRVVTTVMTPSGRTTRTPLRSARFLPVRLGADELSWAHPSSSIRQVPTPSLRSSPGQRRRLERKSFSRFHPTADTCSTDEPVPDWRSRATRYGPQE
jgi:hypothetical protein